MPRIIITSDLHLGITSTKTIAQLVAEITALQPDAVVVAGDLGEPLHVFERCLDLLGALSCPVGIIAGNHDIWVRPTDDYDSADLFFNRLPAAVRAREMCWLEKDVMRLHDGTVILGTLGWYDYSCRSPLTEQWTEAQFAEAKPGLINDGNFTRWKFTDPEFAAHLTSKFEERLSELQADPKVTRIVVATHVPVCTEQLVRNASDHPVANAYFANFTLGRAISKHAKVTAIVSGHIHRPVRSWGHPETAFQAMLLVTIGSEYLRPAFEIIEV